MNTKEYTLEATQQELNSQLFQIDKQQKSGSFSIEDIGDLLPVGLLINKQDGANLYMNNMSKQYLNFTREEIDALGKNYQSSIFYDINDFHSILPQIEACYKRNDPTEQFSYFQRLRPNKKEESLWTYVTSKILEEKNSTSEQRKRILIACPVGYMGDLSNKINKLLDENYYLRKNYKRFALLTKREKEIIRLLYQGLSNPQIAEKVFISRHTVEQHRKNIKKKLGIKTTVEMIKFVEVFELF